MKKKYLILFALIPLIYFPCYISNEFLIKATKEDGVYENLGAFFFLLTSIAFIFLASKSKRYLSQTIKDRNPKRVFFIFFALLFFFAFGEEISWGQRIFNYATPDAMKDINAQGEFNLHNIRVFHGRTEEGLEKTGIQAFFTMHRLFYLFFLTYLLFIPVLMRFNAKFKSFIYKIGLPVPALVFGLLFCFNWVYGNTLRAVLTSLKGHAIVEIKETFFALVLLILALSWVNFRAISKKSV